MLLCHRSLLATGNELLAAGRLTDILRRLATFGLTLARLDLRQEAARHTEAVNWIAGTPTPGADNGPAIVTPPAITSLTPAQRVPYRMPCLPRPSRHWLREACHRLRLPIISAALRPTA